MDGEFVKLMDDFNTSPEMFMMRLTNLMTNKLGLKGTFFYDMITMMRKQSVTRKKELYLNRNQEKAGCGNAESVLRRMGKAGSVSKAG